MFASIDHGGNLTANQGQCQDTNVASTSDRLAARGQPTWANYFCESDSPRINSVSAVEILGA